MSKTSTTDKLQIVIPSYGRSDTIATHLLLEGYDYQIVLHNEEERSAYLKNPTIKPETLVVSGQPKGVSGQRQWIQDNLLTKGEWHLTLDDNVKYFTAVPDPYQNKPYLPTKQDNETPWRKIFGTKITTEQFMNICQEMIELGEQIGAYNIGFATTPNHYFRQRKFHNVGYIISKVALRKHVGIEFDPLVRAMDDYAYTAECLLKHGKVLRNDYVFPQGGHYQKGGIGRYEERLERKQFDCVYLMWKYPGLFRYNPKKGSDKSELAIRLIDEGQVERWQFQMRQLQKTDWFDKFKASYAKVV